MPIGRHFRSEGVQPLDHYSDFADPLKGLHRSKALGIAKVVMLDELAVNRALDSIDPKG